MMITEDQLDKLRSEVALAEDISEKRRIHILAVEKMAIRLGELYLPEKLDKLRAAALLHDITKEYDTDRHVGILESHGIVVTEDDVKAPKTLHARTAALLIPEKYPEFDDPEIISMVRWHTTGHAGMTLAEKIIYLADYIDESRKFPDCVTLRNLFFSVDLDEMSMDERLRHLDDVIIVSYRMTVGNLVSEGLPVSPETSMALDELLNKYENMEVNMDNEKELELTENEAAEAAMPSLADASSKEIADYICKVLDEKKAHDVTSITVAKKTIIAEEFVLCTGSSNTQVRALTDEVEYKMGLRGIDPLRVEGRDNNAWVIIDYGTVIVHIFSREARQFYNIEKLYEN